MKNSKLKFLVSFIAISLLFFSSCSKDDDVTPDSQPYQATQLPNDVTDLFIAKGDLNADTVWIYEQGGPSQNLRDIDLESFPNHGDFLNVYVHQILSYSNDLYDKGLTIKQAEAESDLNSEILHKVIKHYKDLGKTVIVIGHSYGAFVINDYLAKKGSGLADKYVLMAGRLDIEQEFYEGLLNNRYYYYPDYVTPTLDPVYQPENNIDTTELMFLGIIGKQRYTEALNDVDLSNTIYVFANDDQNLGRMTTDEKNFLVEKNAQILEIESGGHSIMFDPPYNQEIYDLMIQ